MKRKHKPVKPPLQVGERVRVRWEPFIQHTYRLAGTLQQIIPPGKDWRWVQFVVQWDEYEGPEYFGEGELVRLSD